MATTRTKPATAETNDGAPIGDVNTPLTQSAGGGAIEPPVIGPPQLYPAPTGPHYIRILSDVTIRIPPYEGFRFQMVKNFKMRLWDAVTKQPDFTLQCRAFGQIFLKHYDWCDDEGNPLPRIEDDPVVFVDELPMDLYQITLKAIMEEANRVPDFPTPTR